MEIPDKNSTWKRDGVAYQVKAVISIWSKGDLEVVFSDKKLNIGYCLPLAEFIRDFTEINPNRSA